MGDRVLFQVFSGKEVGPVVYGHWSGDSAPSIVEAFQIRMAGRGNDVSYATARLVQELIGNADGNTGFGVWNAEAKLTAGDSHGDAGIVLLDAANAYKAEYIGGYLAGRATKKGAA